MAGTKVRINEFDGPVTVRYVAWASVNTNYPVTSGAVDWTGWTELGSSWQSPEGLTIDVTSATDAIRPAGFDADYTRNIISGEVSIKVNMEKADLEEMELAIGNCDYFTRIDGDHELAIGSYGAPEQISLGLAGYTTTGTALIVYCDCVVPGDSFSGVFKREQSQVPFEWVCLQKDKDLPFVRIAGLV